MALPYFHASLMLTGFLLFACGVSVAVTARGKRWRIRVHRAAGAAGLFSTLIGISAIVIMVEKTSGAHFTIPHALIGLAAAGGAVFTPVLGYVMIGARRNHQLIGTGHRWSGRLTLLFMFLALISGARLMGLF